MSLVFASRDSARDFSSLGLTTSATSRTRISTCSLHPPRSQSGGRASKQKCVLVLNYSSETMRWIEEVEMATPFWLKGEVGCLVFVFAVARIATVSSLCVLSRSRRLSFARACVDWPHWFGDGFQTKKKKSWVSGLVRAGRVMADAIANDGRKEWTCKFCSATNVSTRWRCRRCGNNIPAGLQGNHKQATYAMNKEWFSGSSSSRGGEEWRPQGQQ